MYRRINIFQLRFGFSTNSIAQKFSSTDAFAAISSHSSEKVRKISRAMVAYMEQAKARDVFIKKESAEYELGKRHLANMMGLDATTMTKEDVNDAIAYLLPSGLHSPRSRPMMKPPEDLYPSHKPVQFDVEGRPYHSMFYTRFPNFYQILYDIREKIQKLQAYEDVQLKKGAPIPTEKLSLSGTDWMTKQQLSTLTLEELTDELRAQIVAAGNDLVALPYSFLEENFIKTYRSPMGMQVGKELEELRSKILASVTVGEDGRKTAIAKGFRTCVSCTVKLTDGGSGKISIDGMSMDRFYLAQSRENILFPFILLERLGQFDLESTHTNLTGQFTRDPHSQMARGESVVASATRHGISLALLAFVTPEEAEKMRLAGLLTRDVRVKERKKIGQPGARAKWIWKKR